LEIQYLKGIGPKRAEIFNKLGFYVIEDFINYFPKSYIDRTSITNINQLKIILRNNFNDYSLFDNNEFKIFKEYSVMGKIISKKIHKFKNKELLEIILKDNSDILSIHFWNRINFFDKLYNVNQLVLISGTPELGQFNKLIFTHPEVEILDKEEEDTYLSGAILPKYKILQEFVKANINQKLLRKIIRNIFESFNNKILETLPDYILNERKLISLAEATRNLHFPESKDKLNQALHRMKFDEIFFYLLYINLYKYQLKENYNGLPVNVKSILARKLYNSLPFELTLDQKKVLKEITKDLESGRPMNRLIQGDVGSGKTIVSLLTMLIMIDNGYQCLIMAPTEILAEQHFQNINNFIKNFEIDIFLFTGNTKEKYRQYYLNSLELNKPAIIVGTHALFQKKMKYSNLGLIIIDEQHRFGVEQRANLIQLGKESLKVQNYVPHILVLSATPIPRTLSMTIYGDLDISIIKTKPKNRKPIITKIVFESQITQVYEFIKSNIANGYQAFIVLPLVEKSEKLELKSAIEHYNKLVENEFKGYKLGLLHGQMNWKEKEEMMNDFKNKKYNILVATTVIEVGIDIPNANIIVIEDSYRYGLSQLHQLRGRVGRSDLQSYCFLVTKDYFKHLLNKNSVDLFSLQDSIIRLKTMEQTNDGFEIAEVDLKLRGPGDLIGTKQSGLPDFKFIDLTTDGELISDIKKYVEKILNDDPKLSKHENKIIKEELFYRYSKNQSFFNIA
jgi:ATP-dependent DNA helicase RecG